MRFIFTIAALCLLLVAPADARTRGIGVVANIGNGQFGPNFLGNGEYKFVNALKEGANSGRLNYGDSSGFPGPDELDGGGYPLFGANALSHGGWQAAAIPTPSQAIRPGNYVLAATGSGIAGLTENGATVTAAACTGTPSGSTCNNAACTQFTGSISGNILTVTNPSSCSLVLGQPISNGSTFANQFSVPTIITAMSGSNLTNTPTCPACTGVGGNGTYLVNWSQSIASTTFNPGLRLEIAVTAGTETTTSFSTWKATITAVTNGNTLGNMSVVHKSDEGVYANGQLTGGAFKQRVQQGNFVQTRDLNTAITNSSNVTTWATRKPASYAVYNATEMRNSIYGGTASLAFSTTNDYSINLGAAAPVDKQTVCFRPGTTAYVQVASAVVASGGSGYVVGDTITLPLSGTTAAVLTVATLSGSAVATVTVSNAGLYTSKPANPVSQASTSGAGTGATFTLTWSLPGTTLSIDGGATKHPLTDFHGSQIQANFPRNTDIAGAVYDAFTNTWISTVGAGNISCLNNGMPPEAFVQMNIELGTSEWVVMPMYASDPITDYATQYAMYIKANHPSSKPVFEIPDETWNCFQVGAYASFKAAAYAVADTTWNTNRSGHASCANAPTGDLNNWTGKVGSLLGQAIKALGYGYYVAVGVQGSTLAATAWNDNIMSSSYVGQNPVNIPTQSGCAGAGAIQTNCPAPFLQQAAYKSVTDITESNYWLVGNRSGTGLQAEVAQAYCYFYQSAGCASQASLMTAYMNTYNAGCSGCVTGGGAALDGRGTSWRNFANTCAGGASCTPLTVRNYEGGYSVDPPTSDQTVAITAAVNGTTTQLTNAANGCVAGQSVKITAAAGGTWSTVVGNTYTVQATGTDSTHCAINLDSSLLGTLTSATVTYVGSTSYVTYFRQMSTISPDSQNVAAIALNTVASPSGACSPNACTIYPSLFNLAVQSPLVLNQGPFGFAFDVYGYFPVASCTSCTMSGTNSLTLGGTITGVFTSGLTVLGKGLVTPTITGACSKTGSGPAGSNVGDVCPLSVSATTSGSFSGNVTPGTTKNPVTQWQAYCNWNGNGPACATP